MNFLKLIILNIMNDEIIIVRVIITYIYIYIYIYMYILKMF